MREKQTYAGIMDNDRQAILRTVILTAVPISILLVLVLGICDILLLWFIVIMAKVIAKVEVFNDEEKVVNNLFELLTRTVSNLYYWGGIGLVGDFPG